MGGYENLVKTEQIRKKVEEGDLLSAQNILDTMDLKKVKNISDLNLLAEVYKENGRYDDSAELYLKVYEKSKTRKTIGQLVNISIKRGNIDDALYYLEQYKEAAPDDYDGYIYQYKIDKMKGASYEQLIIALETLKSIDYTEKWAYELAKLYYKAGLEERCIEECSDIILWFGEGIYVEKAKMLRSYFTGEADREKMMETINFRPEVIRDILSVKKEQKTEEAENFNETEIPENFNEIKKPESFIETEKSENFIETEKPENFNEMENPQKFQEIHESQNFDHTDESNRPEEDNSSDSDCIIGSEEKEFLDGLKEIFQNMLSREENDEDEEPETGQVDDQTEIAETGQVDDQTEIQEEDLTELNETLEHIAEEYQLNLNEIFGDFLGDPMIKKQLVKSLEIILHKETKTVLMIIAGSDGADKARLTKDIALFLNKTGKLNSSKVARIAAVKLNKVNLEAKKETLKDCCLVIEDAGELNLTTIDRLLDLIKQLDENIAVIFETDNRSLNKLFRESPILMNLLHNRIYLPN